MTLIKKYINKEDSLYLFSTLDNVIPMLVNKSNSLPCNELVTCIMTRERFSNLIDFVKNKKPSIIFSDINN